MTLTWATAAKLKMMRKKSALTWRATLQHWPSSQRAGKNVSANNAVRGRFRRSPKPSEFCQSQNRPSTVAEDDFLLVLLPAAVCAPGIRREGRNWRARFSGLVVRGGRTFRSV